MEKLRTHLNSMSTAEQAEFADRCRTSIGYLRKAISTGQELGPEICAQIDVVSAGSVRRWDLRPRDWHLIWPELVRADGSPDQIKEG